MTNLHGKGLLKVSGLLMGFIFTNIGIAANAIIPFAVDKIQDDFAAKIASGELQEITVADKKGCKSKIITSNGKNNIPGTSPLITKR